MHRLEKIELLCRFVVRGPNQKIAANTGLNCQQSCADNRRPRPSWRSERNRDPTFSKHKAASGAFPGQTPEAGSPALLGPRSIVCTPPTGFSVACESHRQREADRAGGRGRAADRDRRTCVRSAFRLWRTTATQPRSDGDGFGGLLVRWRHRFNARFQGIMRLRHAAND
jgi:hypothetical protein